jgi:hypothetical protein
MTRITIAILAATLGVANQVAAQTTEQWGVSLGMTPTWHATDSLKFLLAADEVKLQGSEFRIGVVRGWLYGGDWGFSFVDKPVNEEGSLNANLETCSRGTCGIFYRTLPDVRMTGIEFHQFHPFKTWKERVQLGTVGAIGIGWLRGNVYRRTTTETGDVESFEAEAGELFPPRDSMNVMPLLKLELAVAGILAPGFKVRASGGLSMPGYETFSLTFVYMIPKWQ